jgi:hypothetical protein
MKSNYFGQSTKDKIEKVPDIIIKKIKDLSRENYSEEEQKKIIEFLLRKNNDDHEYIFKLNKIYKFFTLKRFSLNGNNEKVDFYYGDYVKLDNILDLLFSECGLLLEDDEP